MNKLYSVRFAEPPGLRASHFIRATFDREVAWAWDQARIWIQNSRPAPARAAKLI